MKELRDIFKENQNRINAIQSHLITQDEKINIIQQENSILRKKLEFFSGITSDSQQLNEFTNIETENALLEKALCEVSEKQNKPLNEQTQNCDTAEEYNYDVLDKEQKEAYNLMEYSNQNLFITGKAGTGKSFLLNLFRKASKKINLVVAPTGVSALNVNGATIHSTFGFDNLVKLSVDDINDDTLKLKFEKRKILKIVQTIIIDEISMVRADVFEKIDKILRIINNTDKLFGGKQLIIFGDLFQLPPIADSKEEEYLKNRYGGIFFFFSNAYKQGNFKFVELNNNHRQNNDSRFFEILNRMREGILTTDDINLINEKVSCDNDELKRVVKILPQKGSVDRINKDELDKIPAKEFTYEAEIVKNKYPNQNFNIEKIFPITSTLKLKKGALVMMTSNDANRRWVNGTLGIISYLSKDVIKVAINGLEYEIFRECFEAREAILDGEKIIYDITLSISQYPIILAYAITIHKSQGKTYQRMACDVTNSFAPGQAYVAFSRCSSLNGLTLMNKITGTEILVDSDVKNFYLENHKNIKNDIVPINPST